MALTINKALSDLSKLKPLDRTNYKCWSHKLLVFFEQLEVHKLLVFFEQLEFDYVSFFDLTEENNASETFIAFLDGTDKDKTKLADKAIMKKNKERQQNV